jgi:acetyltransferase-like isoleucine patch superfamily enzyme
VNLLRGVRIHPAAALLGAIGSLQLARRVRIARGCILRADGAGEVVLGTGVWFARDVEVETETRVTIGPRTTVQRRCSINGTTRIGADCILAPDVFISSGTHPFRHIPHLAIREQERRLAGNGISLDRPVWIQDDCWIGTHVVVCPGVTIGKGCVVGANSVVTRDIRPYAVVAGSPAAVVGERLAWIPPQRVDAAVETDWPYVLSGSPENGPSWTASGIQLSSNEPVLVALQPAGAGASVRIGMRCRAPTTINVNGIPVEVTPATTELTVAAGQPDSVGATLRIELPSQSRSATVTPVVFTTFELLRMPQRKLP